MNKNPYLNALYAALYIVLLVLIISNVAEYTAGKDNIFTPMIALSTLVLSVAIMGYLFAIEPLRLFMENKRQEGVRFFGKTVATFACFVIIFIICFLILS